MRISDWSSDVCSSDLHADRIDRPGETEVRFGFADEHGRAAIAGVAIDCRLGRAIGAIAFGFGGLGVGGGEETRPYRRRGRGKDRQTISGFHHSLPFLQTRPRDYYVAEVYAISEGLANFHGRSEERRVGKECVSTYR